MKAIIDSDTCIGCALCTQICPEVFAMEGDKAVVIATTVPDDYESSCEQAVQQCPVNAITIQ